MTVPIVKENREDLGYLYHFVENCHFCKKPTRHWHMRTNNPVCPKCSKLHRVAELPDRGKILRKIKRDS